MVQPSVLGNEIDLGQGTISFLVFCTHDSIWGLHSTKYT
jgi:hypothetical protein